MFLFKLALALGKTVAELKRELTTEELCGWVAFNQLHPIDLAGRIDVSNAIGFAALVSCWGGKCKPQDLIPDYDRQELPQDVKAEVFVAHMKQMKKELG